MELMFYYCRSFSGQGIGAWDTSSLTNMYGTFENCLVFNGEIGAWDTSQAVLKLRAEEANGCLDTRRLAVEESNSGRW